MALRFKCTASAVIIALAFVDFGNGMNRIFGKNKSSEETPEPSDASRLTFRAGRFKRLEWQSESQQVRCNDQYYMLSYLHLTDPRHYIYPHQVDIIHRNINNAYAEWTRKVLKTAFNVARNVTETDVPWLMYLYVKRIEVHAHAAKDPRKEFLPVLRTAHYGMYKVLLCTMFEYDCTMFGSENTRGTKGERKFPQYVGEIKGRKPPTNEDFSRNSQAVLDLLDEHWPDLEHNSGLDCCHQQDPIASWRPSPSIQPLAEEHFTKDLLHLNDVFKTANAKGRTLLRDFGVFEDGDRLIRYLNGKIDEINSGSTPFSQYVLSLVDFHEHVQRALKTMMLHVYYDFVVKLKTLSKELRKEHVKYFLSPYNDWCDFLYLPKRNNGFEVNLLKQTWDSDDYYSEIVLDSLNKLVIDELRKNSHSPIVYNHTPESLQRIINIDESQLMIIVQEYVIPLEPRFKASEQLMNEDIRSTILCAEVLVGFMKNIFDGVNFRAIQSLVHLRTSTNFQRFQEYQQQYDPDELSREDVTNSIKVCGTETVQYTIA